MSGHGDHDEQLGALLTVLGQLGDAAAGTGGAAGRADHERLSRLVACRLDLLDLVAALVRRSGSRLEGAGPCPVGPVGGDDDDLARAVAAAHPHPEQLSDQLVEAVDTAALVAVSTAPGAVRLRGRLVCTADLAAAWSGHLDAHLAGLVGSAHPVTATT